MDKLQTLEATTIINYFSSLTTIISDEIIDGYGRVYSIDDKKYPSVTTFLSKMLDKSWLEDWIQRIGKDEAEKKTKAASNRGTSMHYLVESYLKNQIQNDSVIQHELGFGLFKKLRTMYLKHIIPIEQEVPLWSDKLSLAGRVDCVGYYKGILSIIDFKSSNREKTLAQILGYFIQTTLYALMLKEMTGVSVKQVVILIVVDKGFPQEFIRPTKNYIKNCLDLVKEFKALS